MSISSVHPNSKGHPKTDDIAPSSPTTSIWLAAIERYYDELAKGGIKAAVIDRDLWRIRSPEELLAQIEAFSPSQSDQSRAWTKNLSQLRPILLGLNDFAALAAWALGMEGKVAAVLWGSIRLIIKFAQPILPDIVKMLETLHHALPRMQMYENELPMTEPLEKALLDMYSEVIVFCAHAIAFFRNNPNVGPNRHAWSQFSRDFAMVVENIQKLSRRVDETADMIRLSREARTVETVAAFKNLQLKGNKGPPAKFPCFSVPYGLHLHLFAREMELQTLQECLDPSSSSRTQLQAVGIHGLGGVGKSQLALQYANTSMQVYDLIAWIASESQIKLIQSLSDLARKLGLAGEANQDDYISIEVVRDWLNTSGKTFLLIFDNVDDIKLLRHIWPSSNKGSIIITTRSPVLAAKWATKTMPLGCFPADTSPSILVAMSGTICSSPEEDAASAEICKRLGGLPLAVSQVADFIRERGCTYAEFLKIYDKSAHKVLAKADNLVGYDHTVLTTWEISLEKLSAEAARLQNLLVFFDPDKILEKLVCLSEDANGLDDPDFEFLKDSFDFSEAVVELTRGSMISKLSYSESFSMHRLVQLAVFLRISKKDRPMYFDTATRLLYYGFPNTWNARGPHQGHGFTYWTTCSEILPHVSFLMDMSKKYNIKTGNAEIWAELIFRTGAYLWEKDQQLLARAFFETGLSIDDDSNSPVVAQAYRYLGHISVDLAHPRAGLAAYKQALTVREAIELPDSPPIADVYDSIACAYTEAGDIHNAFDFVDRATAIHNAHDPSKMSRTLAIRSMACLRDGQADNALDAIQQCWKLQDMTQDQIATSQYPKHSGDIVLLARILWLQGERDKQDGKDKRSAARELASRAITMRRGTFGEIAGPRVADAIFILATMLRDDGEPVLAAQLLREIVSMAGTQPIMQSHRARALWFLGNLMGTALGQEEQAAAETHESAKKARGEIESREWPDVDSDEGFMRLVSWMVW
ncbi:tpr repeat-containing protein [Grosmannia clavigera kw1407]|uniref:Tpr repeat-containing protein n=1 Tax=Grosmannia clavigera (strain kw1407 / UAMH 11150) TaxID=655863 RepID=F0XSM7_GROCL|nr:tpr repeat-containing protein [Grosmannia clavigera kw1407]EFW99250.1 tpr repeat-containing protein [Grosmannia clavigera kw1407]